MLLEGASVVQANRILREASKEDLGGVAAKSPVSVAILLRDVDVATAERQVARIIAENDTFGLRVERDGSNPPSVSYIDERRPVEVHGKACTREELRNGDFGGLNRRLWSDELYRATVIPLVNQRSAVAIITADHLLLDDGSKRLLRSQIDRSLAGAPVDARSYREAVIREATYLEGPVGRSDFERWRSALDGTVPFPSLQELEGTPNSAAMLYSEARVAWERTLNGKMPTTAELFHALALSLRSAGMQRPVIHIAATNRLDPYNRECVGWFAHSLPVPVASTPDDLGTSSRRLYGAIRRQRIPLPYLTRELQPECFGRHARMPRIRLSAWPYRATPLGRNERAELLDDFGLSNDVLMELPESYSDVSFDAVPTTDSLVLVGRGPETVISEALLHEVLVTWTSHVSIGNAPVEIESRRSE